ncbi:hypothetical protein PGN89_22425 [Klebsiella aerogenes]
MGPESWSAIAGGASAFAAALSLIVTCVGLKYQRKTLLEAMRKNVIDALSYQAERANASCSGKSDSQWSFTEFANIMFAIDTARNMVARINESDGISRDEARLYFVGLLNQPILSSLKNGEPPDGAFQNKGAMQEGLDVIYLWNPNAHFLGFTDVDFGIS